MRIHTSKGWVNTRAGDGTVLLKIYREDDESELDTVYTYDDQSIDEVSDYETETDGTESELDPYAPAPKPARQYYVIKHAKLRIGFESDSVDLGFLESGIVVTTLEGRLNENGHTRIRINRGWVSTKALDGTELLFPLRGLPSDVTAEVEQLPREERLAYLAEAMVQQQEQKTLATAALEDSDMETESDWTTGADSWMKKPPDGSKNASKQYKVMKAAKLRAGFHQASEDRGQLNPGEVIEALQGKINDQGNLRLRTARGWVSTKASDGTRLLRPMRRSRSTAGKENVSTLDMAPETEQQTDTETETETETDVETETSGDGQQRLAAQYEVVLPAKMRKGFEPDSALAGTLKPGEIIDVLDGRLN
eukprot:SAG31_NODE_7032_length_1810_cov_1.932788_2_plen_364_part_01